MKTIVIELSDEEVEQISNALQYIENEEQSFEDCFHDYIIQSLINPLLVRGVTKSEEAKIESMIKNKIETLIRKTKQDVKESADLEAVVEIKNP